VGLVFAALSFNIHAAVVNTESKIIDEYLTWTETDGADVDGDTLIKMNTGLEACPQGVYIKNAEVAKGVVSAALAAYMSNQKVVFQVWDDESKFWNGSVNNYCKVRAIVLGRN